MMNRKIIKIPIRVSRISYELILLRDENKSLRNKIILLEKLENNRSEFICRKCGVRQEKGDW